LFFRFGPLVLKDLVDFNCTTKQVNVVAVLHLGVIVVEVLADTVKVGQAFDLLPDRQLFERHVV